MTGIRAVNGALVPIRHVALLVAEVAGRNRDVAAVLVVEGPPAERIANAELRPATIHLDPVRDLRAGARCDRLEATGPAPVGVNGDRGCARGRGCRDPQARQHEDRPDRHALWRPAADRPHPRHRGSMLMADRRPRATGTEAVASAGGAAGGRPASSAGPGP